MEVSEDRAFKHFGEELIIICQQESGLKYWGGSAPSRKILGGSSPPSPPSPPPPLPTPMDCIDCSTHWQWVLKLTGIVSVQLVEISHLEQQ